MRLIDADEIRYTSLEDGFGRIKNCIAFSTDIDKAPTVEAVPIDWVKKWFSTKMNSTLLPRNFEMVCNWMLYDWDKENAAVQ